MAEAKITLTLNPQEFDTLRNAVESEQKRCLGAAHDKDTDPRIRHDERVTAVQLGDLLGKLR